MAYRITRTVGGSVNPDPMLAMAEIGLLSNLELWIGIIVACMPTLAPVLRTYVQPSLVRISRKLYGSWSTSPSQDDKTPRSPLRTIGGSGAPHSFVKNHKNYSQVSETFNYAGNESEELGLVRNQMSHLQTNCASGDSNVPQHHGGIYVQKQFHMVDV